MNTTARKNWNPQLHKDTVAFSSVLGTGLLFIWFAAATSVTAFDAAPAMTQHGVRAANAAHDSRIIVTAPHLKEELDPANFWQIHRATIVNSGAIAGVVRGLRDQADLKLKGRPEVLAVSRAFTHLFKQM